MIQVLPHDEDQKAASEQDEADKVHASKLLALAAVPVEEMEAGWMVEEEEKQDGQAGDNDVEVVAPSPACSGADDQGLSDDGAEAGDLE